MNKHLAFGDLVAFLYEENPDEEFKAKISEVNAHLFACPECRKQYQTILHYKNAMDAYCRSRTSLSDEALRERLAQAIGAEAAQNTDLAELLERINAQNAPSPEAASSEIEAPRPSLS